MTIYELDAHGIFTKAIDLATHKGPIGRYVAVAPPSTTKRQVARWTGQAWEKVTDYTPPVFPVAPTKPTASQQLFARLQRIVAKGMEGLLRTAIDALDTPQKEQAQQELRQREAIRPDGVIAGLLQTAPFNTVA